MKLIKQAIIIIIFANLIEIVHFCVVPTSEDSQKQFAKKKKKFLLRLKRNLKNHPHQRQLSSLHLKINKSIKNLKIN